MNAGKYLGLISLVLLTACAPKPQVSESTLSTQQGPQAGTGQNLPPDASMPGGSVTVPNGKNSKQPLGKSEPGKVSPTAANSISSWELSGAMAARSKKKAWSASVNWLQRGLSSYQIRLFGPLGGGTVMIERNGGVISYRDGPKSSTSSNADQLLMKETGVRLPVNSLYYWVRGVPAPGAVQGSVKNSAGYLSVLKQGGYTIQYLSYTRAGSAYLPSSIKLEGNGVFIKFVIKSWRV